ncbi:MAG: nicotinate (nicotinamide) nucleotide adenylyltransferase, partial [Gemmatimonadetes bacterium]|nr:nicotinate (nicotinamide) nucleotide adenylyltransferase [Gemmatimonadota bacterium]
MRFGIFGGTFDPPHVGHLIVAQDIFEALELDRLLFIPAPLPPHKRGIEVTPAEIRLRMVEAAVAGDSRFEVSDVEFRRPGPSYTVDTLRDLHHGHPGAEFDLVIGTDQLAEFANWRQPEEVARLARLAVIGRGGLDPRDVQPAIDVPYRPVAVTRVDVSARAIRKRVREGRSIRYMVTEAVRRIIEEQGLYLSGQRVSGRAGGRVA